jgi:fructose-bisphosphate aldolase class II
MPDLIATAGPSAAFAAFNVITLEHAEAIVWAAEECGLPVIVQLSENSIRYHRHGEAIAAAIVALADQSTTPVVLHLDHITDEALAKKTAEWGFSSLMWDASTRPYDDNVASTRHMVDWGTTAGVWVESELGEVGGKDGAHAPGVRTHPHEARAFVDATGVNALAVAVGSSHAMQEKTAALDIDLIRAIAAEVDVPLVLHGSSGVPDDTLAAAVAAGMRKINIGTALNLSMTATIRTVLTDNQTVSDPRKYLEPARLATIDTVSHLLRIVSGQAT